MSRFRACSEHGAVAVIVAVMMGALLLLAALVVSAGEWFTHKRQLQTRADAGATAAGVEYGTKWAACVGGDAAARNAIISASRQYAGDPNAEMGVYDPLTAPPVNTEIADQSKLDVWVNSTSYDGPSYTDGGDPCVNHAPDDISPAGGYWTDVRVKERDFPSVFGLFGLPLARNTARARVEIKPAISDNGFVPLGIPDNRIVKAQARFYNECTGQEITGARTNLLPLRTQYQTMSAMALWGPGDPVTQTEVDPSTIPIQLPVGAPGCPSGQDYVPIAMEIRVAGRPDIDLDQINCNNPPTSADCFSDITEVRVWAAKGQPGAGLPGDRPLIGDVKLSGPTCAPDPYYARTQVGQTSCGFSATVDMDWADRPGPGTAFTADLLVDGDSFPLARPGGTPPNGIWTAAGTLDGQGPSNVQVDWEWKYKGPGSYDGKNCNQGKGCDQSGTITVHRTNLADDPGGDEAPNSDVVALAKTTNSPNVDPAQGPVSLFDSVQGTGGTPNAYLTVGLKSAYTPGQFAVLRLRQGQRNFSLVCDPRFPTPSSQDSTAAFYYGCEPPYGKNTFAQGFWWDTTAKACPAKSTWFNGPPFPNSPWKCVHLDTGGNGFAVADGVALATGNCAKPDINPGGPSADCKAHDYVCTNPINYTGPTGALDPSDPRIIKIYILPFGAFKKVQPGNGADLPVIDFAAFYVTGWKFNNRGDPCPGNDNAKLNGSNQGEVAGYFIKVVEPNLGPTDPDSPCVPGEITPCRAVLVR